MAGFSALLATYEVDKVFLFNSHKTYAGLQESGQQGARKLYLFLGG
jgi:hypothetical protein